MFCTFDTGNGRITWYCVALADAYAFAYINGYRFTGIL